MTTPPQHSQAAPPPGWYENDGSRQWWDGNAWGPVAPVAPVASSVLPYAPEPIAGKQRNSLGAASIALSLIAVLFIIVPKASTGAGMALAILGVVLALFGLTRSRTRLIGSSVVGLILCAIVVMLGAAALQQPAENPSSSSNAPSEQEESVPAGPTPEQQRDTQMQEQGFVPWQSGETWLKAAEPGSFTCDSGTRCLWYTIASYSGCPAGFYVKADILNENDLAIDWTNEITASVAANDGVAFQLRTMTDGSKFRPTEVSCMG